MARTALAWWAAVMPFNATAGAHGWELDAVLGATLTMFEQGATEAALTTVFAGLNLARKATPVDRWRQAARRAIDRHPLQSVLLEDPLLRRALEKPCGYAGDATVLDFLYQLRTAEISAVSPVGQRVHRFVVGCPAPTAVRTRLRVLSDAIARVGARTARTGRVLSVACGHMRELALVPKDRWPAEIVGLDHDPGSLELMTDTYADPRLRGCRGSVRDLLGRRLPLGTFDLVYSAGLFDYLEQPCATALVARLLDLVAPGGTLLIANFTDDTPDIGFMEAVCEWYLVYRTEAEMVALLSGAPLSPATADVRVWRDEGGCVVYLEVRRSFDPPEAAQTERGAHRARTTR